MKALLLVLGLGVLAFVVLADDASATTVCHASGNWCQGYSHASTTTGGVGGAMCFDVRLTNTAPTTCSLTGLTPSNEAGWEVSAGSCVTAYYHRTTTGGTVPGAPNKVTIDVRYDNSGTVIKTFQTLGAEPASGTGYTFCGTSDGNSGSSPRAGTVRFHLRLVKDNGPAGVGNYDITSDGAATVGTNVGFDKGTVRVNMLVSSIARSAYPAGSTFAYGPAADEVITITGTFTQPFADSNLETMRTGIFDAPTFGTAGQVGATVDVDAATTLAQNPYVVDSTFAATTSWVPILNLQGTSAVTSLRWTTFATTGHGANIVYDSDTTVHDTTTFNIDPAIAFDADGAGTPDDLAVVKLGGSGGAVISALNRGEGGYEEHYLANARGELLSRAMTHVIEDASGTVCSSLGSLTPSANKYSATWTVPTAGSCTVAAAPGAPRYLRATNTEQNDRSGETHTVSPDLFPDAHPQDSATLDPDDYPTPDATETLTFHIRAGSGGADDSDHIRPFCKAENVRHEDLDTSGAAIAWTLRDPTTTIRASGTTDSGSDGWTVVLTDFLATTPLGTEWTLECAVAFNGNTGTDTETFTVTVEGGGGQGALDDPLTVFCLFDASTDLVHCTISSRLADGTARLDAEDEIFLDIYDASHALLEDDLEVLEQAEGDGAYYVTWPATADGLYEVVAHTTDPDTAAPIGAHNIVQVNNQELYAMSFNTLEFDGFLFLLFWGSVLLYCLARSRVFAGFTATLGLLETVMPTVMPGSFLGYFFLLIIAVWLEAIAGEKIYGKWLNKGKGDTENT